MHLITTFALGFALAIVTASNGAASEQRADYDPTHSSLTGILKTRVKAGAVDYAGLKRDDLGKLDKYVCSLGTVTREAYGKFGREEKLAFWINAYNASTLILVSRNYPVDSIRSIGSASSPPFKQAFISLPGMRDRPYSLDEIENQVLRKEFNEPRIHFALVCAAKSCPPLSTEAFRAADLEKQLAQATRAFLTDKTKNRVDGNTLQLSSIFDWFKTDFEKKSGSVAAFVRPHLGLDPNKTYDVKHLPYDWSLNGR